MAAMNADRVVHATNEETTQEANTKAIMKGTKESFSKTAQKGKHNDAFFMGHNRNEYQSREMAQVKMECHLQLLPIWVATPIKMNLTPMKKKSSSYVWV